MSTGALQLDRAADDLDDVDAGEEVVDEGRRDHGRAVGVHGTALSDLTVWPPRDRRAAGGR